MFCIFSRYFKTFLHILVDFCAYLYAYLVKNSGITFLCLLLTDYSYRCFTFTYDTHIVIVLILQYIYSCFTYSHNLLINFALLTHTKFVPLLLFIIFQSRILPYFLTTLILYSFSTHLTHYFHTSLIPLSPYTH